MKKYANQLKRIRGEGGEGGGRDTKEVSRTTLIHGRTGRVGNWNIYIPIPSPRGNSNVFRRVTTLTSDLVRPSVLRLLITERWGWGGGGGSPETTEKVLLVRGGEAWLDSNKRKGPKDLKMRIPML